METQSESSLTVSLQEISPPMSHTGFTGQHLPFVGFTYTTSSCFADGSSISRLGRGLQEEGQGGQEVEAFERRIRRLEQEKQELNRKLQGEADKPTSPHIYCDVMLTYDIWRCRIDTGPAGPISRRNSDQRQGDQEAERRD